MNPVLWLIFPTALDFHLHTYIKGSLTTCPVRKEDRRSSGDRFYKYRQRKKPYGQDNQKEGLALTLGAETALHSKDTSLRKKDTSPQRQVLSTSAQASSKSGAGASQVFHGALSLRDRMVDTFRSVNDFSPLGRG